VDATPEHVTELQAWQPDPRSEALRLAVALYALRPHDDLTTDAVLLAAGKFTQWLTARPASIRVGDPVITAQGHPGHPHPLTRTGPDMAVTMKDTDNATYPAAEELDSKGFPVQGAVTVSEDSNGAVVAMTANDDGTTTFAGFAPGAAQVTWTDGTISFADTINVTAGDAATIVVGAPTITPQG